MKSLCKDAMMAFVSPDFSAAISLAGEGHSASLRVCQAA